MSNIKLRRNARIADNNQLDGATITAPEDPLFPFAFALDFKNRGKVWRPLSNQFTIEIDMGYNAQCSFFAIFGEVEKYLKISDQAVITIRANMINLFTGAVPFEKEADVRDKGVFCDLTDEDNPTGQKYRYWQVVIDDEFNPEDIEVSAIFLGDHIDFQFNAKQAFAFDWQDLSRTAVSDSGVVYTVRKNQFKLFDSMGFVFLNSEDRLKLFSSMERLGLTVPFIFILDPLEMAFEFEYATILCYFQQFPKLTHAYLNKHNMAFSIREIV